MSKRPVKSEPAKALAVIAGEPVRRQLLRLLLWKPGKEEIPGSFGTVFGRRLTNAELDEAARTLGVDDAPSELDRFFAEIIPFVTHTTEEAGERRTSTWVRLTRLKDSGGGKAIKAIEKADVPSFCLACALAQRWATASRHVKPWVAEENAVLFILDELVLAVGGRKVPWPGDALNRLVQALSPPAGATRQSHLTNRSLQVIGDLLTRPGFADMLDDASRACLPGVRDALADYTPTKLDRERLAAVDRAIAAGGAGGERGAPASTFHEVHRWAKRANEAVAQLPAGQRAAFAELARHASTCNPSRVSNDWNAQAVRLVDAAPDRAALYATLGAIIDAYVEQGGLSRGDEDEAGEAALPPTEQHNVWDRRNENDYRLLGLLCVAGVTGDAQLAGRLADAVERAARAPRRYGLQHASFATACVRALALPASPHVALLNRLGLRVKWPPVRKLVAKVTAEAAKKSGLSPQDAEETTVPDFGLRDGRLVAPVGDHAAELDATDAYHPRLAWRKPDGSPARSLPAALKKANAGAVESIQRTMKDVEGMLPAQRTRLELLLRDTRRWRLDAWRQRYLEHGLLAPMVRRLIWTVDGTPVLFDGDGGVPRDVTGKPITFTERTEVAIWHPVGRRVEAIVAWRRRLEELRVAQPFKQAHREVYLITDAERRTRTYSNRFAAHIVKAPTLIAIGQTRKWTVSLYGEAKLALPQFGLRAEFWSHEATDGAADAPAEHRAWGGPRYLATDQVRFYRDGEGEPLPLADVPPLAFSEVMRDVDLFVGIASVGADPNWRDGGNDRYRDYWQSYSFGDLGETAKTRRTVLERLVPRLKIADRAALGEKFLVVRGDLRTYKIHLGSGNVLMEPNDQYLCIVPARGGAVGAAGAADGVLLPFEGDTTLSVILSKAFLLADDERITDETIVRQIKQ